MRPLLLLWFSLCSLCLCGQNADLVVTGGTIVTMDAQRRIIENGAVAVERGRIVAVGPRAEIEARYPARQRIDASGRLVLPGLINTHTHAAMIRSGMTNCRRPAGASVR